MARISTELTFMFFLTCHLSSTDTHSLQYLYTNSRPVIHFPEFIALGLMDGEEFVYYDNNVTKMIPKTKWIKDLSASDPDYWRRETECMRVRQDRLHDIMTLVMRNFNHKEGAHVLQLMYSCQHYDADTPPTSYMQFGYNGEDFFHLDLKTGRWITDKHQAEIIINTWDPKQDQAKYWKDHLETDCTGWLQKYMDYSTDRKDRPEVSLFQNHLSSSELVCHATGFFPKALNITWQKDREDVYGNVELRETLPNQDGSFQKGSVLKVSAEELQKHKYTCVIQHSSLEEDLVLPVSERRILRGGGSAGRSDEEPVGGSGGGSGGAQIGIIVGIIVALVVVVAGIVIWNRRNFGRENRVI